MEKKNINKIQEIFELLGIDNNIEKKKKNPINNNDIKNNKKIVNKVNEKISISNKDNNNFISDTDDDNKLDLEKQYNLFLNEYKMMKYKM